MRELKFRAWDKLKLDGHGLMISWIGVKLFNCKDVFENPDIILMQYTGLKDKNGKEIYEGDIITANIIEKHGIKTRGEIVYDDYFLFYANKNYGGNTPLYKLDNIEIIGNIYKNPELIK